MVRMHVVKLSHLILGFIVIVLAAVAIWLLASGGLRHTEAYESRRTLAEAEAVSVSASAVFAPPENEVRAQVIRPDTKGKRVLIYHTHTHEAYEKQAEDVYVETSAWRTKDNAHNIVYVGEVLAELLTEKGFSVIHDETDHELNELSTAYTRSLKTMQKYDGEIDIYIDMHRDAYSEKGSGSPFSLQTEDVDTARLMFLVGNGKGFSDEMFYKENYELATLLTGALNELLPGIARPVMVKDGRYNQHLSEKSLLVEVGHNRNSIEQALAAMPYLAEAFERVFS